MSVEEALSTRGAPPAARNPFAITAGIGGMGSSLPPQRVGNDEIATHLGLEAGWIEQRTGIRERRRAAPGEGVSDLASRAGRAALQSAGLEARDLDMVLVATLAADDITPGAAPIVAESLGAVNAATFDVGAACAGSLAALALATGWIESGRAQHVLVIGAEVLTRFVDPDDRRTMPLFGDGAGAIVLSAGVGETFGPFVFGSDGSHSQTIRAPRARGVLEMDGHETFLRAVEQLSACTREVLVRAELELADVDLFVYHQANARILSAVADRLGVRRERVFNCIAEFGNTSAASLPLALEQAVGRGELKSGDRVVLGAIGAGLVWGATVLRWGL